MKDPHNHPDLVGPSPPQNNDELHANPKKQTTLMASPLFFHGQTSKDAVTQRSLGLPDLDVRSDLDVCYCLRDTHLEYSHPCPPNWYLQGRGTTYTTTPLPHQPLSSDPTIIIHTTTADMPSVHLPSHQALNHLSADPTSTLTHGRAIAPMFSITVPHHQVMLEDYSEGDEPLRPLHKTGGNPSKNFEFDLSSVNLPPDPALNHPESYTGHNALRDLSPLSVMMEASSKGDEPLRPIHQKGGNPSKNFESDPMIHHLDSSIGHNDPRDLPPSSVILTESSKGDKPLRPLHQTWGNPSQNFGSDMSSVETDGEVLDQPINHNNL